MPDKEEIEPLIIDDEVETADEQQSFDMSEYLPGHFSTVAQEDQEGIIAQGKIALESGQILLADTRYIDYLNSLSQEKSPENKRSRELTKELSGELSEKLKEGKPLSDLTKEEQIQLVRVLCLPTFYTEMRLEAKELLAIPELCLDKLDQEEKTKALMAIIDRNFYGDTLLHYIPQIFEKIPDRNYIKHLLGVGRPKGAINQVDPYHIVTFFSLGTNVEAQKLISELIDIPKTAEDYAKGYQVKGFSDLVTALGIIKLNSKLTEEMIAASMPYLIEYLKNGAQGEHAGIETMKTLRQLFAEVADNFQIDNHKHREFIKLLPMSESGSDITEVRNLAEQLDDSEWDRETFLGDFRMMIHNNPGPNNLPVIDALIDFVENNKDPKEYNKLIGDVIYTTPVALKVEDREKLIPLMDTIHQLRDKVEHLYNKASQETLEELQTSDLFADNQRFKDILTETLSTEARTLEEKNKKLANILELRKIVQNGYKTTDTEKDRYFLIDTALENVAYTEFASATELVKTVEDKTKVAMFIYLGMELSKLNGIDNIVIDTLINEAKKELERIEQDDASNEKILARLRKLFLRYSDEAIVVSKIFEDNLAELLGNYTGKLDLRNMAAANKNNDFDIFSDQNSDEDGTEKRKKTEEGLSLVRKTNIYHLVQELMPQVVAFPEYKRKSIGELRKELGY